MKEQVIAHLGPDRVAHLSRFFGGSVKLDDMIEIALIAARKRAITEAQKPIAAAISVLRRAGIPAPQDLLDTWEAAGASSGPLPAAAPVASVGDSPSPKMKPHKSKSA